MFFQKPQIATNDVTSVPAPTGGLNARDSLVAMPPGDAIVLENWWPQPYGCSIRKGSKKMTTGLAGRIDSFAEWADPTGGGKLFAWAAGNMYDVTAGGAVGAALVTALTNSIWNSVQVTNAAGNNLIALNGIDDGIIYTSGGVARIVAGTGVAPNTWAGINPNIAVQPTVHQHRLWVVERGSSAAWFLPPDAVQGTFVKYDFGPLFSKGGYLAFLATWTVDDGNGAEDHLVGLSSNGEAVVYGGTDPTDDTKWFLVGVYVIGAPVSSRIGFAKAGGDLLALTEQGVVSMSAEIVSTKVESAVVPLTSNKIQYLISTAVTNSGTLSGWDLRYYPRYNMVLVNVPTVTSDVAYQIAANQLIGSWCTFTNKPATMWGSFLDEPVYGTADGIVYLGWSGSQDDVEIDGSGGSGVIAKVKQAFNYFGSPATIKQVGMYRPTFVCSLPVSINSAISYDFTDTTLAAPGSSYPTSTPLWGIAIWGTAVWGGSSVVQKDWISGSGMGSAVSLQMVTQSDGEVLWVTTDYVLEKGWGVF
jgi:hypothetical protein